MICPIMAIGWLSGAALRAASFVRMNTITIGGKAPSFLKIIGPIVLSVFAVYLSIGIALGVLPSFITNDLHYSSWSFPPWVYWPLKR
jgi:hypothetical protein